MLCISFLSVGFSAAATVYVGTSTTSGTVNYKCDGSNDHIEINQALTYTKSKGGGTVYLRGPNTYWIDSTLNIGANTILTGDSTARIKLIKNAGWAENVPLIANIGEDDDITIKGFTIDGNSENQGVSLGNSYYILMYFDGADNIEVSDMSLEWGCSDGLKTRNCNGITFTGNDIYKMGHDALYAITSHDIDVSNNIVFTRTNSACRLSTGAYNVKINDNIFYSSLTGGGSTGPAIQLDKSSTEGTNKFENIEIYNNKIYNVLGAAIWMSASYPDDIIHAKNVRIHHNTFSKVGQYGSNTGYSNAAIILCSFDNTIIENNVFDDGGHAGIKWFTRSGRPIQDVTYTTTVRNNIIMNSDGVSSVTGSGVGIWNTDSTHCKFVVQNNDIYNNKNGQTYGSSFTLTSNLNVNPQCIDSTNSNVVSRDYHLKSKAGHYSSGTWIADSVSSTLIDAGYSSSSYSNEPSPNGGKINIGRYGNTAQASKSGSSVPNETDNPPVANAGTDKTATIGSSISFNGSASTDDKGIASYSWDFDASNGITSEATGKTATKTYSTAGTYTVTLTVTDTTGQKSTDTIQVIVSTNTVDNPPVANAGADKTTTIGSTVSFNASLSTDDKGITSYSWDFDSSNGITSEATGKTATKTYSTAGTYTVTLTVTDTTGQNSTDTIQVIVSTNTVETTTLAASNDNRLRESSPSTVFSTTTYLDVGKSTSGCRDLLLFDLSAFESTDTISKATLDLYWYYPEGTTRSADTVVEVYRPQEWDPDYVSWNNRISGTAWTTAGGNWYDKNGIAQGSTPYASITFPASTVPDNKYYQFDVTELVQEYIQGNYNNTGFYLKAKTESNNYIAFYSSEWSNTSQRPKLTITS